MALNRKIFFFFNRIWVSLTSMGQYLCATWVGVCYALTLMMTPDLCGVPPQAPFLGFSHRGKQRTYCNSFWFIDNMLLKSISRAAGGEFRESKQQQGSVVSFLCLKHHCLAQQWGAPWQNPMLSLGVCWLKSLFSLIARTCDCSLLPLFPLTASPLPLIPSSLCSFRPKEVPATTGFLPSPELFHFLIDSFFWRFNFLGEILLFVHWFVFWVHWIACQHFLTSISELQSWNLCRLSHHSMCSSLLSGIFHFLSDHHHYCGSSWHLLTSFVLLIYLWRGLSAMF